MDAVYFTGCKSELDPSSLVDNVPRQHDFSKPQNTPVEDNVLPKETASSTDKPAAEESKMSQLSDNSCSKLRPGFGRMVELMILHAVF